MRIKWHQWVALALLVAAVEVWSRPPDPSSSFRAWRPVHFPLLIRSGELWTPSFTADLNETYSIMISGTGRLARAKPTDFDVSWVVFETGIELSQGNSKQPSRDADVASPGWVIGEFRATKGKEYRVKIRAEADMPELDTLQPRLQITGGTYKEAFVGNMLDPIIYSLAWRGLAGSGIVFLVLGSLFE